MNITDIDDKIIRGAAATGEPIDDARRALPGGASWPTPTPLRMTRPDVLPRATEHIERDRRAHRDAPRARPRLSDRRRLDLLPDLVVARLRPPGPPRPRGAAGGGAGRGRRIRQGRRPRLRPVEGPQARRAVVGDADRAGPARLAHRVLGDEHGPPRSVVRHPHRRRRPDLPAPRGRDRPERGGDRPDVRRDVAPLRPPPDGRREDGQVDRQHRPGRRAAGRRRLAAGPAARAHLGPLPGAAQPFGRVARGGGARRSTGSMPPSRRSSAYARGRARRSDARRRRSPPPARRSGRPSTTTSTCRPALAARVRPRPRPEPPDRATLAVDAPTPAARCDRSATSTGCSAILPDADDDLEPDGRRPARRARGGTGRARLRGVGPAARRAGRAMGVTVEDTRDGQRWRRTGEVGRG